MSVAGVAHPVERHLAKVEVASSSLVTRSKKDQLFSWSFSFWLDKLATSPVTRSAAVRFRINPTKKATPLCGLLSYFAEDSFSRNGSSTFIRTRESR